MACWRLRLGNRGCNFVSIINTFFSVPGMGSLLTDAINRYDTSVVQTLVILYAALGIIGVFLGDVLMMIIDPRITLTGKGGTR